MKHTPILATIVALLLMTSCAEDVDKSASRYLTAAQTALADGQFADAKLLIDSIKIVYPKAFETRKAGIALLRQVEMAEANQTLTYTASWPSAASASTRWCLVSSTRRMPATKRWDAS